MSKNCPELLAEDLRLINACADPAAFARNYCQIYDNETERWIPFTLWPAK